MCDEEGNEEHMGEMFHKRCWEDFQKEYNR